MKPSPRLSVLSLVLMAWALAGPLVAQNFVGLVFDQPFQANNATHPQLGDYYTGTTFDFLDVAPASGEVIDARLTISGISSPRYTFGGTFPDHSPFAGGSGGDLGLLYAYTGGGGAGGDFGEGGVTYRLEFYSGGGLFNSPVALSNLSLMIYDIDGEPSQSESLLVYAEDGLASYQLSNASPLAVSQGPDGSHRFSAPLEMLDADDPASAVILHYADTSSVRFRLLANTNGASNNNNAIYHGLDGDLSLIGASGFASPVVVVPEPSVALLACGGLLPLLRRRRPAAR
jgi:hypothetical protein